MWKMMSWLLLLNVAEVKKRGERRIDEFRKKLMIPESEIREFPEHAVKSKIESTFLNEKNNWKYSVRIYKTNPYFCKDYIEKIQADKNGCEYILFRIDNYFTEYLFAIEIDEKNHVERDLIVEEKRQEVLEKKFGCKLIRINTSKEGYDADYEVSRIQTFIIEFRDWQLKDLSKKIKELEDKIQELKLQLTSQSVYNALSKNTTYIIKMVGKIYYQ